MGKTPKPLTFILYPPCSAWEEFTDLEAQGHTIIRRDEEPGVDMIMGATCHCMSEHERKYLTLAIGEARRIKYGKGGDK